MADKKYRYSLRVTSKNDQEYSFKFIHVHTYISRYILRAAGRYNQKYTVLDTVLESLIRNIRLIVLQSYVELTGNAHI